MMMMMMMMGMTMMMNENEGTYERENSHYRHHQVYTPIIYAWFLSFEKKIKENHMIYSS